MNSIQAAFKSAIPTKHKSASKGWTSFNCPACVHHGERPDTKGRGGLIFNDEDGSVSYHCFNCHFSTGWKPGMHFGYKLRKLCTWLGMDEGVVHRLVFDAMRELDTDIIHHERHVVDVNFQQRPLPDGANIVDWVDAGLLDDPNLNAVISYIYDRGFQFDSYDWYWSNQLGLKRRLIIPYTWRGKVVGYASRNIDPTGKKYIQSVDSDYVFGMDQQTSKAKFSILVEGTFDAIAVGGIASLTNAVSEQKAELIDTLGKDIIVVPDRDKSGGDLIESALKYKWDVSFPNWEDDVKDCADAHKRYGKLYTIRSILAGRESNPTAIQILRTQNGY